jgi:hypothetical protein
MKQHKWHKEIKAWADGAEIEYRFADRTNRNDEWELVESLDDFGEEYKYRIKSQPKEPQYLYVCYCPDTKEYSIGERGKTLQGRWINLGKIKLEVEDD